jgi:hypothetical protein
MDDPGLEEKFSSDIDCLLHGGDPEKGISVPEEYSQMLNTVRGLVDLDLSPQSRIRASLRRRLMDEWDVRKARSTPMGKYLPAWFSKWTVPLASVLLIVAGFTLFVGLSSRNSEFAGPEGSSQYRTPGATEDSVAYWDMHWRYITLYGTIGTRQDSALEGGIQ